MGSPYLVGPGTPPPIIIPGNETSQTTSDQEGTKSDDENDTGPCEPNGVGEHLPKLRKRRSRARKHSKRMSKTNCSEVSDVFPDNPDLVDSVVSESRKNSRGRHQNRGKAKTAKQKCQNKET